MRKPMRNTLPGSTRPTSALDEGIIQRTCTRSTRLRQSAAHGHSAPAHPHALRDFDEQRWGWYELIPGGVPQRGRRDTPGLPTSAFRSKAEQKRRKPGTKRIRAGWDLNTNEPSASSMTRRSALRGRRYLGPWAKYCGGGRREHGSPAPARGDQQVEASAR